MSDKKQVVEKMTSDDLKLIDKITKNRNIENELKIYKYDIEKKTLVEDDAPKEMLQGISLLSEGLGNKKIVMNDKWVIDSLPLTDEQRKEFCEEVGIKS